MTHPFLGPLPPRTLPLSSEVEKAGREEDDDREGDEKGQDKPSVVLVRDHGFIDGLRILVLVCECPDFDVVCPSGL